MWDRDLRKASSVRPILELLRLNESIPYIHRECATGAELNFYLSRWPQRRYSAYPILYLASHGEEYGLTLEDGFYSLDDIGKALDYKCEYRVVMISSCNTLRIDKRHLKRFLQNTNCLTICGYKADVDWMRSAAFELLHFSEMQENEFSGRGIDSIQAKVISLSTSFPDLMFRMVTVKDLD